MTAAILPGNYSMLSVINVGENAIKPMDGWINLLAWGRPALCHSFFTMFDVTHYFLSFAMNRFMNLCWEGVGDVTENVLIDVVMVMNRPLNMLIWMEGWDGWIKSNPLNKILSQLSLIVSGFTNSALDDLPACLLRVLRPYWIPEQ